MGKNTWEEYIEEKMKMRIKEETNLYQIRIIKIYDA